MALADDIILRVPDQVLIEHTNQRDPSATAVDSTALTQAASDVTVWFETYAEEAYDSTVEIHVQVGIRATMSILRDYGGQIYGASTEWWERFEKDCERVRNTRARARIEPSTNSKLTPSDENPTGAPMKPWADDAFFDGLTLRRGGAGTIDPNDEGN